MVIPLVLRGWMLPRICEGCFQPDTLGLVSRRIFQAAAVVVMLFATLTPLANCFDTWDKNPAPANDTEMHLAAWFAGAGIVLVMTKAVRIVPVPAKNTRRMRLPRAIAPGDRIASSGDSPLPTASPPLIPLRI